MNLPAFAYHLILIMYLIPCRRNWCGARNAWFTPTYLRSNQYDAHRHEALISTTEFQAHVHSFPSHHIQLQLNKTIASAQTLHYLHRSCCLGQQGHAVLSRLFPWANPRLEMDM